MVAGLVAGLIAPLARAQDTLRTPGENDRAKLAPIVIQNYRPHDSRGINMFETPKLDGVPYNGFALNWGASFAQPFQALHHSNTAAPVIVAGVNQNQLLKIGTGFDNASANMYLDAQLAKNIRVEMTSYLSSRHHNETWVKDGYLLVDGSPWAVPTLDNIMKVVTLKVGHFEVNYGDAHFRASDNGNAMFNPLVGNLIMNAFTTEVGAEAYLRKAGWLGMVGVTNGEIRGTVRSPDLRAPTYLGKLGFDRQLNTDLRVRLTGSIYSTAKSINNTLYSGSRAGSRYFDVLVNTTAATNTQAWTGDVQPGLSSKVQAMVFNPFIKWRGVELFGNVEQAKGRSAAETADRKWTQMAGEALYRFAWDDLYVAARYNTVKGRFAGFTNDVTVNRVEIGGGWFLIFPGRRQRLVPASGPVPPLRRLWVGARSAHGIATLAAALVLQVRGAAAAGSVPEVRVLTRPGVYEVHGEFKTRAPLATAWEVLTDYERIGSFVSSIRKSEVVSRQGDSVRVRQAATVGIFPFKRTAHVVLAVNEQPRERIDFVDISGLDFRKYAGAWTLHANADSTVIGYTLDASPRMTAPGWLSRGVLRGTTTDLLSQVRAEIERRAAAP
jgi:carbon monoxide dehydrogenase subunit G